MLCVAWAYSLLTKRAVTMKSIYVGIKAIAAVAMTRQEYNDYRGWQLPTDEEHLANEQGYLVEYLDGGKANDPRHAGYISWSPEAVFNNAYKANGALGFSEAHHIALAEQGKRIQRSGWNGADLAVYYVQHEHGLEPHMVIRNGKTGRVNTWVPSSADLVANDWSIL